MADSSTSGKRNLIWWRRLASYVLLICAVLTIADLIWEGVEEGKWKWYRFGTPMLFIAMAIAGFAMARQEQKRAEQDAANDRGSMNPQP